MLIRFTRGTVWAGRDRIAGETLDVDSAHARLLVEGYKVAAYLDEAPPAPRGMVVNADPVVEARDQVPPPKRRRA
jgi:hypothetical protein